MNEQNKQFYPKKLSESEKEILFSVLPQNKPGYNKYRLLLDRLFVIGEGRFGKGNLILGKEDDLPDLSISSSPVFALGYVKCSVEKYYVIIHTLDEEKIEVQIDPYPINKVIKISEVISYSKWKPGMNSPETGSRVNEYLIEDNSYMLAICPESKKIWLHEYDSEVNYLIPVSNFFNELMRVKKIKDENIIQTPSGLFKNLESFSDYEIKLAFLLYNKYLKRFKLNETLEKLISGASFQKKKKMKLFGRG